MGALHNRRPEAAVRARALVQMFPSLPICRFTAGLTLLRHGFVEEAAGTLEEGLGIVPGDVFLLGVLALVRARQGRLTDAEKIRDGLEGRAETQYTPFLSRAFCAEACGDLNSSYRLMAQAIEEREPLTVITLADRRTDLPVDARHQALLCQMNLA